MKNKLIKIILVVFLFSAVFMHQAEAGVYASIKSFVVNEVNQVSSWWKNNSVINEEEPEDEMESGDEVENRDVSPSGMCSVPQGPSLKICDIGAGFLCLNTPESSVKEDFIIIKGTIDNENSVPASIRIAVQHEYTKVISVVDTSNPNNIDCWNYSFEAEGFCLSDQGYFSAKVPLDDLGPYTISVSATRFSGSSKTEIGYTSKVVAPILNENNIEFVPDIRNGEMVEEDHLTVRVSLLESCQYCDFIGASTYGVNVVVENKMTDSAGQKRTISCSTNVEQNGQGQYELGIPVGGADNELTITVCNAATEEDDCPKIEGIKFGSSQAVSKVNILKPYPEKPSYSSEEYPIIEFEFEIQGNENQIPIDLTFNRDQPITIEPDSIGKYKIELEPQAGINVLIISNKEYGIYEARTFGWGKINSPYDNRDVKDGLNSDSALQLLIPEKTITEIIGPFVSNLLSSDELQNIIDLFFPDSSNKNTKEENSTENIEDDIFIPFCEEQGGSLEGFELTLLEKPELKKAKIENILLSQDSFSFLLNADEVSFVIGLIKPDEDPVPLKISFLKLGVEIKLEIDKQNNLILLTSPYTDCDYKKEKYCKSIPNSVIPQNFIGNADVYQAFVKCDVEGRDVSETVKGVCSSLNTLNRQTGLVNQAVLDAINSTIYCTGSKFLTQVSDKGFRTSFGISDGMIADILGSFNVPLGANFKNGITINDKGILLDLGLIVGDKALFTSQPEAIQIPSVGVVNGNHMPVFNSIDDSENIIEMGLAVDSINYLLFIANLLDGTKNGISKTLLDINLSEKFFNDLDFDFVEKCDEDTGEEETSILCNLRPRVAEMLGASLTNYGYFDAKHPLLIRINTNKVLAPRISIVEEEDVPVVAFQNQQTGEENNSSSISENNLLDVQLGGFVISFYALEVDDEIPVDQYGNISAKLDENGEPIILSMNPDDSNPLNGQIASFELTVMLPIAISDVQVDSDNPDNLAVKIRILSDRSRFLITPFSGTNTTTIPLEELISQLEGKLLTGISGFSSPEKAIKISIPRDFSFSTNGNSLFTQFGLAQIKIDPDGLGLEFKPDSGLIVIDISGFIKQVLHFEEQSQEFILPY